MCPLVDIRSSCSYRRRASVHVYSVLYAVVRSSRRYQSYTHCLPCSAWECSCCNAESPRRSLIAWLRLTLAFECKPWQSQHCLLSANGSARLPTRCTSTWSGHPSGVWCDRCCWHRRAELAVAVGLDSRGLRQMSVKRQHQPSSSDDSTCVLEEAHPALKRLRIADPSQVHSDAQQPDQQVVALQQQNSVPATTASHHTFYPLNALLKQLHMERLQRQQHHSGLQLYGIQEPHVPGRPS